MIRLLKKSSIYRSVRALFDLFEARRDPVRFARSIGVSVGNECRLIDTSRRTFGSEPYLISMGDHVTVTAGVKFITHDGGVWVFRKEFPDIDVFGAIRIGNNVFIGLDAILMPGATVGNNVVVGAGSLVTGELEDDGVYVGVPARKIMSISEYKEKVLAKSECIRSMESVLKVQYLKKMYAGGGKDES